MKRFVTTILAAAALTACFDDPTEPLRDSPDRLTLSRSAVTLTSGDSIQLQVELKDDQGNQLPLGAVTWTSADPTIASVSSTGKLPGELAERASVLGVTNAPGTTLITVAVGGISDSVRVTVLPASFSGTAAVTGTVAADTIFVGTTPPDTLAFMAGDTITLTLSGALTFTPGESEIHFGATNAFLIASSATQLKALALTPVAGPAWVTALSYAGPPSVGTIEIDSLQIDSLAIRRTVFTMTASVNGTDLLDTVTVTAPSGTTFITSGPDSSIARLNGHPLYVITQTAGTITGVARMSGTAAVTVTNIQVGSARLSSLSSAGTVTIGTNVTDATEPANDAPDTVAINVQGTSAASPLYLYGTANDASDVDDFYTFTTTSAAGLVVRLEFAGTGAGGASNPDHDLYLCDVGCNAIVGAGGAATGAQPEVTSATAAQMPAGDYNIYINAWDTGGATRSYRLVVYQVP